jgi:hypothetical protein
MTEVDKAYIAGFFDGEGHVCIVLNGLPEIWQTRITVGITQNNREVLEWIQGIYGGSLYKRRGQYTNVCGTHERFTNDLLIRKSENIIKFLLDILPYLRIKTEQAFLALEFCSLLHFGKSSEENRKKRIELRNKLLVLNSKDKPVSS